MFVSDKRVDVLVRVQRPEDWSLVRDKGQDRQQGPTQVRTCDRIRLRVNLRIRLRDNSTFELVVVLL